TSDLSNFSQEWDNFKSAKGDQARDAALKGMEDELAAQRAKTSKPDQALVELDKNVQQLRVQEYSSTIRAAAEPRTGATDAAGLDRALSDVRQRA
ncbi:hypothetical protein ACTGXK_11995, partial [Streptococcus suis]